MIKLKSLINEVYIDGFTASDRKSKFHKPENFDEIDSQGDWSLWAGGNDWEVGWSAACVYFSDRDEKARLWIGIKYPEGVENSDDNKDSVIKKISQIGKKAVNAWKKAAKGIHSQKDENGIRPNWKTCWVKALSEPSVTPHIKSSGIDSTHWKSMKECDD